jgi:Na+/H+ antiporter NhaD/arsenite permease-like protein
VASSQPNITLLTDADVDKDIIFENNNDDNSVSANNNSSTSNNGINAYDVIILGHQEYVTQKEYYNLKRFVGNGGTMIVLDGNVFYAEVRYDENTQIVTLVKGHSWAYNGRSAWRSVSIGILLATIAGFIISDILQFAYHTTTNLSLSIIAMLGATALYALSKERGEILVSVDYSVLVFFAAMFVFTYGLWSSGVVSMILSHFPTPDKHDIFQSNAIISAISITLSQVLSNVPFVAIYNTVMINNGFTNGVNSSGGEVNNNTSQWMMLAAASTIAGNLTILAAASNIIIIEAAESRSIKAYTFFEYFKIGVVVTLANMGVYYLFLLL